MKPLLLFIASLFFALPAQAIEDYRFDPNHTYVLWHVSHFGFSTLSGKSMAKGILSFDEKKPENSKVSVVIDMTHLTTGIEKFDSELKSSKFFDVKRYPTASFESAQVKIKRGKTGKVYGVLTIHGISKPVVLSVKLNRRGMHPYYQKKALGFSAHTMIKRSDFDVAAYTPGVADEVNIDIQAEALINAG